MMGNKMDSINFEKCPNPHAYGLKLDLSGILIMPGWEGSIIAANSVRGRVWSHNKKKPIQTLDGDSGYLIEMDSFDFEIIATGIY